MAIQQISPMSPASASSATTPVREVASTNTATPQTASPPAPAAKPSPEQIDRAMSEMRRYVAPVARNLQFSIDDATGRSVVKVVDSATNEVIRQIPSEELLQITRTLDSLSGLFVKQKA